MKTDNRILLTEQEQQFLSDLLDAATSRWEPNTSLVSSANAVDRVPFKDAARTARGIKGKLHIHRKAVP